MAEPVVDQPRTTGGGTEPLGEVAPLTDRAKAFVEEDEAGASRRAGEQLVVKGIVGFNFKQWHRRAQVKGERGCGRANRPGRDGTGNRRKVPAAVGKGKGREAAGTKKGRTPGGTLPDFTHRLV